jgi:hypothetical protein
VNAKVPDRYRAVTPEDAREGSGCAVVSRVPEPLSSWWLAISSACPLDRDGNSPQFPAGENDALADRESHVCKAAAVWWDGRRAIELQA